MRGSATRRDDRPEFATTQAAWVRQVSRAVGLLIVVVLVGLLFRAGREVLAEGERLALGMAEEHLEDLVWLEGKRVVAEEGSEGLRRRAGSDPRTWAQDWLVRLRPEDALNGPLPAWADERWDFDAARGELVYRATWMPEGDRRWRVALHVDGVDSSTPGLARDLLLVPVAGATSQR